MLPVEISEYLLAHCTPADDVLRDLAAETRSAFPDQAGMQVSHDEGELLTLLVKLSGARRAVEVGVFTGYSGLCIARGLPADGRLLACDVSEEFTGLARRYWERAGVAGRIELRIGPALDTLRALAGEEAFDFAFIDADKTNYDGYYERALTLLRQGGLIVIDNVLWSGAVADPKRNDADTTALRALNRKLHGDERIDLSLLPLADGITLARKR